MTGPPKQEIALLCQSLGVESSFLTQCLQESIVEIEEIDDQIDLGNGTVLQLRRLQRICETFNVDLSVALLLLELTNRITELERQLQPRP